MIDIRTVMGLIISMLLVTGVSEAADCKVVEGKVHATKLDPKTTYGRTEIVLSRQQILWADYISPNYTRLAFLHGKMPGTLYCDSNINKWLKNASKYSKN